MPTELAIFICAVFGIFIVVLMYWRTKHQTKIENTHQPPDDGAISFRAKDEAGLDSGILYISEERIKFVLPLTIAFDLPLGEIVKVIYSNRSLKIVTKQGIIYTVRYLRDGPSQENAIISTATYAQRAHQKPALNNFLALMDHLQIPAEKGEIAESRYFQTNAIIGIATVSLIVILALAHFVFGVNSFLGMKL